MHDAELFDIAFFFLANEWWALASNWLNRIEPCLFSVWDLCVPSEFVKRKTKTVSQFIVLHESIWSTFLFMNCNTRDILHLQILCGAVAYQLERYASVKWWWQLLFKFVAITTMFFSVSWSERLSTRFLRRKERSRRRRWILALRRLLRFFVVSFAKYNGKRVSS